MIVNEIEFEKYEKKGAYHWKDISWNPRYANCSVKARYLKCIQLLEKKLNPLVNQKVLDLGCGDGVLSYMLWKRKADTVGVDHSEKGIELARTMHKKLNSNVIFHMSSAYDLPLDNKSVKGIICSDVIEHVQEPNKLLDEIDRVLKVGGHAVISTPIRRTKDPLDKMHVREWFEDEFVDLIKNKFTRYEVHYTHPIFWGELMFYRWGWILLNLISFIKNPFLQKGKWRYMEMQYAVVQKNI